jgi:hypothetical protein
MTLLDLRVFNESGNAKFSELVASKHPDTPSRAKRLSLDDSLTTAFVSSNDLLLPTTKLELGQMLWPHIRPDTLHEDKAADPSFWNWLAARLMSETLETSKSSVGDQKRWVYTAGSRNAYRHLMSSAYLIYSSHSDDPFAAMAILCSPLGVFGEVTEQILASRSIAGSVGTELATSLYYDPETKKNKAGSGGKDAGSPRRLAAFLNQIKLTVDYKSMTVSELLDLLPEEFERFR